MSEYSPEGTQKPRRGRPPKQQAAAPQDQQTAPAPPPVNPQPQTTGPVNPRSAKAETKARRRRRDVDSEEDRNMKLAIPAALKDPNYEYRWINDTAGGRIMDKTQADDWDQVTKTDLSKEGYSVNSLDTGDAIKRVVGSQDGRPLYAYLCRKPKEFYEEDKQAEQAKIDELEEQILRGQTSDPKGLGGPHSYVPGGANKVQVTSG